MRRVLLVVFLCLLCVGCADEKRALSSAIAFRTELINAKGCSFNARITADFEDRVELFMLQCTADSEGKFSFCVLEPETLKDICATVSEDGGTLTYDGMAMDFGLLADGNVIPAAAPALVFAAWRSDYISSGGTEENYYRATYERDFDSKKLIVDTWFEKRLPISAQICYNDHCIIQMEITDFSFH